MSAACADCGRAYGEAGWGDFLVPHHIWRRISPTGNSGGILCVCCMCDRLAKAGIRCEGAFMSGPIRSVSADTMEASLRCENLEERLERIAAPVEAMVVGRPIPAERLAELKASGMEARQGGDGTAPSRSDDSPAREAGTPAQGIPIEDRKP